MTWRTTAIALALAAFLGIVWALTTAARGQEHQSRADWFKSLRQPNTGYSCCDISDCKVLQAGDVDWQDGGWKANVDGEWTSIPEEKILTDKMHPEGLGVVCASPTRRIYCFIKPGFSG